MRTTRGLLLAISFVAGAAGSSCGSDDDVRENGLPDAATSELPANEDTGGADAAVPDIGPIPTELAGSCKTDEDCAASDACVEQLCVYAPTTEYRLTDNTADKVVDEKPELGCINGNVGTPEGPAKATVYGIVDRFGGGYPTFDIEVSFFEAASWPPPECVAAPVAEKKECFRGASTLLQAISKNVPAEPGSLPDQCEKHKDCGPGYECIEAAVGEYHCSQQYGLYEVADVPTNTWLVVRCRNTVEAMDKKWKDVYLYQVYIPADGVGADGRYAYNVTMVSTTQWKTVPNTLQVGQIKANNAAVGGRVRDCGTDARLGYTLGEAAVALGNPGTATGYFNDNEEDTVPLPSRKVTDMYGRFAIVDVPPGFNAIAGAILVDGKLTSLGRESFYLVPDSLAIVSFPGKKPILTK